MEFVFYPFLCNSDLRLYLAPHSRLPGWNPQNSALFLVWGQSKCVVLSMGRSWLSFMCWIFNGQEFMTQGLETLSQSPNPSTEFIQALQLWTCLQRLPIHFFTHFLGDLVPAGTQLCIPASPASLLIIHHLTTVVFLLAAFCCVMFTCSPIWTTNSASKPWQNILSHYSYPLFHLRSP